MLKLAVLGGSGRMGQAIIAAADQDEAVTVTTVTSRKNGPETLAAEHDFDVVIDFTRPEYSCANLANCANLKKPVVIGTTGFSDQEQQEITNLAKEVPIVLAPNMSIGVNILFKLLEVATKAADHADIAIFDTHHRNKVDSPSGTALKMAEIIKNHDKQQRELQISSQRVGSIIGEHAGLFALDDEYLSITHRAGNRSIYAKGAIQAAKWLASQPVGLYNMQQVLGLE